MNVYKCPIRINIKIKYTLIALCHIYYIKRDTFDSCYTWLSVLLFWPQLWSLLKQLQIFLCCCCSFTSQSFLSDVLPPLFSYCCCVTFFILKCLKFWLEFCRWRRWAELPTALFVCFTFFVSCVSAVAKLQAAASHRILASIKTGFPWDIAQK